MEPLKTGFEERMKILLGNEYEKFIKSLSERPLNSIRANELKISSHELKKRLEDKGWKINQPIHMHPEIMVIEGKYAQNSEDNVSDEELTQLTRLDNHEDNKLIRKRGDKLVNLEPGELGRTFEHLLGYYYIQEISSMLPVIALDPKPNERVLDLCASPGSKTTEIASFMKNTGLILANEPDFGRMKILSSNLERCGVSNAIITRKEGSALCSRLLEKGFSFDKILVDAPCSGEGTLRINPKTARMWNPNGIKKMSSIQKRLISSAAELLKIGGEMIYSTCTYAPEEDEEVIDYFLREFPGLFEVEKISIPIKMHPGITKWQDKEYLEDVKSACRIFPFDNNTEGFFITKIRRIK